VVAPAEVDHGHPLAVAEGVGGAFGRFVDEQESPRGARDRDVAAMRWIAKGGS